MVVVDKPWVNPNSFLKSLLTYPPDFSQAYFDGGVGISVIRAEINIPLKVKIR